MSDRAASTVLLLAARARLAGKATYGPQAVAARFQMLGRTIDSQPARLDGASLSPFDRGGFELGSQSTRIPVGIVRLTATECEIYAHGRLTDELGAAMAMTLRDEGAAWAMVLQFHGALDPQPDGVAVLRDARFRRAGFERDPSWKRASSLAMRSSIRVEGQS